MKHLLFILLMLVCLSSCDDDEKSFPQCEFTNPLEDLAWLKEYKASFKDCQVETSIFQATYKKQIVFYSTITDPLANSVFRATLQNCKGDVVRIFKYDDYDEFEDLVINRKVLYHCQKD